MGCYNGEPSYKEYKEKHIQGCLSRGADSSVMEFIYNVLEHGGSEESQEVIRSLFRAGYCYYFAHMLKMAFQRGKVCLVYPFGHFVWMDENDVPYDIEGMYFGEAECFIPEEYLGDMVKDFLHVPGESYNASPEEIDNLGKRYMDGSLMLGDTWSEICKI